MDNYIHILKNVHAAIERATSESELDSLRRKFSMALTIMAQGDADLFTALIELKIRCGSWKAALESLPDP